VVVNASSNTVNAEVFVLETVPKVVLVKIVVVHILLPANVRLPKVSPPPENVLAVVLVSNNVIFVTGNVSPVGVAPLNIVPEPVSVTPPEVLDSALVAVPVTYRAWQDTALLFRSKVPAVNVTR